LNEEPFVIITGGQGDLAQAIGKRLQEAGWQVAAPGRDELDVTSAEAVKAFFADLSRPIDLLINNAGKVADAAVLKMNEGQWDLVLQTNLKGAFLCAQQALRPMMKQRQGHILNIGSFSALCPPLGQTNYAAAKAGLVGLTQSLAKEAGPRNVRVNCILPGFLETKMTRDLPPEAVERAKGMHALGCFNTSEDVASFILALHQMEAVSGQVFQLDSRISRWT